MSTFTTRQPRWASESLLDVLGGAAAEEASHRGPTLSATSVSHARQYGETIRAARESHGYRLRDLANACRWMGQRTSVRQLRRVESGLASPTRNQAFVIAAVLGLDVCALRVGAR